MNVLISVVIPTYKHRGGLYNSILSVLSQTYKNIEVIVVDDNELTSQDRKDTEKVMSRFSDSRIRYIKHECNKNGAAARNTGIYAANGEYIAFLDDDDAFLERKIERQLMFMQLHPQWDAVYCLSIYKGADVPTIPYEGDVSEHLLMLESHMYTPTLLFKKNVLLAIHGFDESFRRHQDFELLLRFFFSGYRIGCLQEHLTVLGSNQGENILHGKDVENLKRHLFNQFEEQINHIDEKKPRFRNRMLAKHYAGVFLNHVKQMYFGMAVVVFFKYFLKSPKVFMSVIVNSLKVHMR